MATKEVIGDRKTLKAQTDSMNNNDSVVHAVFPVNSKRPISNVKGDLFPVPSTFDTCEQARSFNKANEKFKFQMLYAQRQREKRKRYMQVCVEEIRTKQKVG